MQVFEVTAIRYSFRLRREVVFRLTYNFTEDAETGMRRWFLVKQQEEDWHDLAAFREGNPAALA